MVAPGLEVVEGIADIAHRQTGAVVDGVFVLCQECLDGCVAVVRCVNVAAGAGSVKSSSGT